MGKILFADDDEAMRRMVSEILRVDGHAVRLVKSGEAALTEIRRDPPDLTILDYRMGRPNGFEVCRQIKQTPQFAHMPVLILTGQGAIDDRIEGFAAGANDYLAKPFDARELIARVRALLRLSEQTRHLNPTTALPGGAMIEREFERRRLANLPFTLCYLDLDNFKAFNDRFGFAIADAVIAELGHILRNYIAGTGAFAGHIGGDDFVLMCDLAIARPLVERAQAALWRSLGRLLPPEVAQRGTYMGKMRDGGERAIPLTRLSAVLIHLEPASMPDILELAEFAAELKGEVKLSTAGGIAEISLVR
jgi:DNA-binding response OmpR family regulator